LLPHYIKKGGRGLAQYRRTHFSATPPVLSLLRSYHRNIQTANSRRRSPNHPLEEQTGSGQERFARSWEKTAAGTALHPHNEGGDWEGIGFRRGEKRIYSHGETVRIAVRVRNVGREAVKFNYDKELFLLKQPAVADGAGKLIRLGGDGTFGSLARVPVEVSLAPGKETERSEWKAELRAAGEKDNEKPHSSTLYGTGKFLIQYKQLAHAETDPILSKLATGKLELEIKSAPPRALEKKTDLDKDSDLDKAHLPKAAHKQDA
jgi:hypothetical protein